MPRRNVVAASVLLMLSAAYGVLTAGLPERALPNTPGPAFLPWLITVALTLLSLALLVHGLRAADPGAAPPLPPIAPRGWLALAVFLVYLTALPALGFLIASIPFVAALVFLYGQRKPWIVALSAAVIPTLLFAVFRYGFGLLLPRGVWW